MSTLSTDVDPQSPTETVPMTVSEPFPFGWRGEGPKVRTIGFPAGTRRIWHGATRDALTLRPLGEDGPPEHRPVGWLTPDDEILLEAHSQVTEAQVAYLARFFTGVNRDIDNIADMDPSHRSYGYFGKCIRCDNIEGKPHLRTCPHYGKNVGDPVR